MSTTDKPTWLLAERFRDVPAIEEAITNFAHDQTGDNATGIVLAVLAYQAATEAAKAKNRVDFDIPLVAVSKCDMCNDNGSVGFPPDDYYPCPKCTPPTLAATQAGDAKVISIGHGATLQRQAKTTGAVGWLMYNEHGLVRSLDVFETQLVESALAAMSPTTDKANGAGGQGGGDA